MNWFNLQSKSIIKCPPCFTDICCDTVSSIHVSKWQFLIFHFLFYCRNTTKRIFICCSYYEELFRFYFKWCKSISNFKPRLTHFLKMEVIFIMAVLFCKFYANTNNISQNKKKKENKKTPKNPTTKKPKLPKIYKSKI